MSKLSIFRRFTSKRCGAQFLSDNTITGPFWMQMKEGERKVAMRQTMSTGVNHARAIGLCRLSRNV